jgi:hypothetical protein
LCSSVRRGRGEGGATGDEANTRALAGQCCSLFLSRLLLQSSPGFLCVLPWVLSLVFLWFFSSSCRCVFSLFSPPCLCSALPFIEPESLPLKPVPVTVLHLQDC